MRHPGRRVRGLAVRGGIGMTGLKHFLDLDRLDYTVLRDILNRAVALKLGGRQAGGARPLAGKTLAMVFEKPSTRTRVSFEVGTKQLGGDTVILTHTETQLGRGETIADTARVLSRYVDAIMMRTDTEEKLIEMATHATVPVINGLTDRTHPCQIMADIMTFEEHRGPIAGATVAWLGDGNNVLASWVHASARFGFKLRVASPNELSAREAVRLGRAAGRRLSFLGLLTLFPVPTDAIREAAGTTGRVIVAEENLSGLYERVLGERARAEGESAWRALVVRAVRGFVEEFGATVVHLAGGNARRITPETFADFPCPVVVNGNQAPLHGAARLFYS